MPLIDVEHSMLLVIDAQQDFYPDRRTDVDRTALAGMFRRAAWVTAVASRLGVPVVVTEEDAAVNGATATLIRAAPPDGAPVLPQVDFRRGRQSRHSRGDRGDRREYYSASWPGDGRLRRPLGPGTDRTRPARHCRL